MSNVKNEKKKFKDKYELSLDSQKFILQMCWAQHDGQWFLKTTKKFGFEVANELNQTVIKSMGKITSRYILNALGIKKGELKSSYEISKFINTVLDLVHPKPFLKYEIEILSDREFFARVKKCLIWDLVRKAGNESDYTCCCDMRMRAWLAPLGFNIDVFVLKRLPDGDKMCESKVVINEIKED